MNCPRDRAEMETKQHDAGFELDLCPSCKGIWLDRGELEEVKAKVAREFKVGSLTPPEIDFSFSKRMQEELGQIACPRCGKQMDTKEYEHWSQIMVDVCPAGCGLFLDKNEFEALQAFFRKNLVAEAKEESQKAMWTTLTHLFGG